MAKVKCPTCSTMNEKADTVCISKRYYCPSCAEEKQKPKELTDWDYLFQYICWLYGIDRPTGMMFKQLKEYRDVYGYTDIGMYHTLVYYHEVMGGTVLEGAGLGIIAYYYDKAKFHAIQKHKVATLVDEYEHNDEVINVTVTQQNKWQSKRKPLDLNAVDWGEDEDEDF